MKRLIYLKMDNHKFVQKNDMLLFSSHLAMLAINLGLHLTTHAEKEARYIQYGRFFCCNSTVYDIDPKQI
jgi:hypothetical protein